MSGKTFFFFLNIHTISNLLSTFNGLRELFQFSFKTHLSEFTVLNNWMWNGFKAFLCTLKKNIISLLAFFSELANTYINIKPSIRSKKKNQQLKGCNFNIYMNWDNLCYNRKLAYPFYLTLQLQIYFQLFTFATKLLIRFNVTKEKSIGEKISVMGWKLHLRLPFN